MEIFNFDIESFSFLNLIWAFIVGFFAIFLWIFINKYLVYRVFSNSKKRNKMIEKLPLYESFFWLFYVVYLMYVLVSPFPIVGVVLVLILTVLNWSNIKNYMQGLIYRIKETFREGQRVKIDSKEGIIYKLAPMELVLETLEGEQIYFPYKTLVNREIAVFGEKDSFYSDVFEFEVPTNIDPDKIKFFIDRLPWNVKTQKNRLEPIKRNDEFITYKCVIYSLEFRYLTFMKQEILSYVESH